MVWIFKKMCTRWYLDTGTAENADHTDGDQLWASSTEGFAIKSKYTRYIPPVTVSDKWL